MIDFEVRHLATSFGGTRAAAAAVERTVSIWDLQTGEHVSTFQTESAFAKATAGEATDPLGPEPLPSIALFESPEFYCALLIRRNT